MFKHFLAKINEKRKVVCEFGGDAASNSETENGNCLKQHIYDQSAQKEFSSTDIPIFYLIF